MLLRMFGSGKVYTLDTEDYLCGVLVATMPNSWPLEALKATAVALRTLTTNYLREHFELLDRFFITDRCFQIWQPWSIGQFPAISCAVKSTAGQILPTAHGEHTGHCSRVDCPACCNLLVAYLEPSNSTLCHWGAKYFAEKGYDYIDILQFYFGESPK